MNVLKPMQKTMLPLIQLREGMRGTIKTITGGRNIVLRLTAMGLTPGVEVKVLKSSPFNGPIEILVRGSKLAIGRGIAMKIFVEIK
jgi:DtxR family Mn-dependent transcriptional regulator